MQALAPFNKIENSNVGVSADLHIVDSETLDIFFRWNDPAKEITFAAEPKAGRHLNLWQQTCFEAFIQPVGQKKYFEVNLSIQKAWNVFTFQDYRAPQPPTELNGAEVIQFDVTDSELKVRLKFKGQEFKNIKVSLCAVVVLQDKGTTYWSNRHADQKPNFHHFDSFIIERNQL